MTQASDLLFACDDGTATAVKLKREAGSVRARCTSQRLGR